MSFLAQDWDNAPLIRTAQVVGISSAFMIAGGSGFISYGAAPSYRRLPAPFMAKQWQLNYEAGKAAAPLFALASGVSFAYLIAQHAKSSAPSRTLYLYTLAGVIVPAIVPYTKIVMMKLNDRLHAKVTELAGAQPGDGAFEEKGVPQDETVGSMVEKWRRLNAVRAIAGYIGGIAGLIALVWRD
ncbi:hypothetical protein IWZ00DRAFT_373624 [Phyllosticta capitalensis]